MSKLNLASHIEPVRRDTLALRTIVRYDPMKPRPTTPIMIGNHIVARRPLHDSIHTLYMIMDGSDVVATSISHPDAWHCEIAITIHRRKQTASPADKAIAQAKRKPRAIRMKEVV